MKISTEVNQSDVSVPLNKSNYTSTESIGNETPLKQPIITSEMQDENGEPTKQAYQTAVNKLNEFMTYSNRNSKFVFHEGLERYYVEIVDSNTDEVVKEIPPKELLNAYYEMQKMIGKIVDKSI